MVRIVVLGAVINGHNAASYLQKELSKETQKNKINKKWMLKF